MLFRKALIRLRREYNLRRAQFFFFSFTAIFASAVLAVSVDVFLPHNSIWNILRSVLLVPVSLSVFAGFYGIGLALHEIRTRSNPDWVPYRARWSPSWRRRFAIIFGAFLFVVIYSVGHGATYTLTNGFVGAGALAAFAFLRMTKEETERAELGIPNVQDLRYDAKKRLEERQKVMEREEKLAAKKAKRRSASSGKTPSEK